VQLSEAAFAREPVRDPEMLAGLHQALAGFEFTDDMLREGALRLAVSSGTYSSMSEARRAIAQGAFTINGERVVDPDAIPEPIVGEFLILRHGRKRIRPGRRKR
jgi:tyrosyl-tRNA synthetase